MGQSRLLVACVAAFIIFLVGATITFLPQRSTIPLVPQSTTNLTQSAEYETGSTHGLILTLTINSSVISQGGVISLTIVERNALESRNNIASSKDWAFEGLSVGPCGPLNYPFGFEVLSGYYTAASAGLDSAERVQLYQPGAYFCPAMLSVVSYSFFPLSDRAGVMGGCNPEPCFTEQMNSTTAIKEYWDRDTFNVLPVGLYTIIVGDEWGSSLFAHFAVIAPGASVTFNQTQLVQVKSVIGPIPPMNPGGPEVSITLANVGVTSITSLTATFHFSSSSNSSGPSTTGFVFHFNVSSSNPLLPGGSTTSKETLIGAGFTSFTNYPLTINGTLQRGVPFTTTQETWVNPLGYLVANIIDSFCHGPTGYEACVGGDFASAELFNCSSQAATASGCTWKVISSSSPQYGTEVTVWYPYTGSSEPWNCLYTDSGNSGNYYSAYCISSNSTAFVVSEPVPPPV